MERKCQVAFLRDTVKPLDSLMDLVRQTLTQPNNSVLAFCDNSSAIRGFNIRTLQPKSPGAPSLLELKYEPTFPLMIF